MKNKSDDLLNALPVTLPQSPAPAAHTAEAEVLAREFDPSWGIREWYDLALDLARRIDSYASSELAAKSPGKPQAGKS